MGYGEVEPAFGDVRNASDYEKILNYETGVNDFSNMTESDKVYEKNDFEKICNKTNELNIHYDKIENEIDKPLKKVHNVDEILENTKKKQEKPVSKDDDEGESEEFVVPRTPSMAERRKLFETGKILSEEKDIFDGIISSKSSESLKEDESTSQRSSIAGSLGFAFSYHTSKSYIKYHTHINIVHCRTSKAVRKSHGFRSRAATHGKNLTVSIAAKRFTENKKRRFERGTKQEVNSWGTN